MLLHAFTDFAITAFLCWVQWYTFDIIQTGIGPATAGLFKFLLLSLAVLSGLLGVVRLALYFFL